MCSSNIEEKAFPPPIPPLPLFSFSPSFLPFDPCCLFSPAVFGLIWSVSLQGCNTSMLSPNTSWRSLQTFHHSAFPEQSLLPGVLMCPRSLSPLPYLHHTAVSYSFSQSPSSRCQWYHIILYHWHTFRLIAISNFCWKTLQHYTSLRWLDSEIQGCAVLSWLCYICVSDFGWGFILVYFSPLMGFYGGTEQKNWCTVLCYA